LAMNRFGRSFEEEVLRTACVVSVQYYHSHYTRSRIDVNPPRVSKDREPRCNCVSRLFQYRMQRGLRGLLNLRRSRGTWIEEHRSRRKESLKWVNIVGPAIHGLMSIVLWPSKFLSDLISLPYLPYFSSEIRIRDP
jgi:hypothetical protein